MELAKKNFELTHFWHTKVIDADTIHLYSIAEIPETFLENNRLIFEGCKEIKVDVFYYAMLDFVDTNGHFTILHPYRLNQLKYPKRNYGFGGYNKIKNELFMFFNGVATTNNRDTAIQVYNSLVRYCKNVYPNIQPFSIKM